MGCCYCCETAEEKADMIFSKFSITTLNQLQFSSKPQLTTGRVVPTTNKLFSPLSGRDCIHYQVICEEDVETTVHSTDEHGNTTVRYEHNWVCKFIETKCVDFFVCDPTHGNQYLHEILDRNGTYDIGYLRITELLIPSYDQIALLSIISKSETDPNTLYAQSVYETSLKQQYFEENKWNNWEKNAWHDLFRDPCILVTNNIMYFQDVFLPKLQNIPSYLPIITTPFIMQSSDEVLEGQVIYSTDHSNNSVDIISVEKTDNFNGEPIYPFGQPIYPMEETIYPSAVPVYPSDNQ